MGGVGSSVKPCPLCHHHPLSRLNVGHYRCQRQRLLEWIVSWTPFWPSFARLVASCQKTFSGWRLVEISSMQIALCIVLVLVGYTLPHASWKVDDLALSFGAEVAFWTLRNS